MIEKLIEAKIVAAIANLGLDGLAVKGSWGSSSAGTVALEESADTIGECMVSLGVRSYATYTVNRVDIPGQIDLVLRLERDPTRVMLDTYATAIFGLIDGWHEDVDAVSGDLDVSGFEAGGFSATGGAAPTVVKEPGVVVLTFGFAVAGRIEATTTTEE